MLNDQDPWAELSELELEEAEAAEHFPNRRYRSRSSQEGLERRQFSSNYSELSPAGAELGLSIDSYKVANRRRYVTYDEILQVLSALGYHRLTSSPALPLQATDSPASVTAPATFER
ncbi:MAG: hypothetical protein Q8M16_03545 [Pirellulaceae bacterium]|nr:hypothetical protein [Pirellulaceae bacterium]